MTIKIVPRKAMPLGVDLGSTRVKVAQLRTVGEELELLAAGAADMGDVSGMELPRRLEALGEMLRGILRGSPFKGRSCVLCVPAQDTFVHHVKLPRLTTPQETTGALEAEIQGKLPYPVEEAVVRQIVAGDVPGEQEPRREVIVVAARRSTLEAYLAMTRRIGMDVIGINIEACAVVECFGRLFRRASDNARTILFVDLGAASTQAVLSHGGNIVFARNLMVAGRQLDQAVADGMHVSLDQAQAMRVDIQKVQRDGPAEDELYRLLDKPLDRLAGELTQCLRYYESVFRNQAVERAIFVGGQAYDKRLCQSLAQRLNLPAQIGDPLLHVRRVEGARLPIGLDRRNPQPDWAVAVGLSLGAIRAA